MASAIDGEKKETLKDFWTTYDKRNLSLKDAGNFLELLAENIYGGKRLAPPLAFTLASALYDAASKAKAGKQKAAIAAISQAMGLQIHHKRPAAPFWSVVSQISALIEKGKSQTEAITITSKKFGIGKSTAEDYWAKFKPLQFEVIRLVENSVRIWKIVSQISALIEEGKSQTEAITITSKEFDSDKSTTDNYWAKYKEQQLEDICLAETSAKKTEKITRIAPL